MDDLQWADIPSLQLLRHLVGSDQPLALLVIGAFRDSESITGSAVADLLAQLHREDGVARMSLGGLGNLELLDLVESVTGSSMGEAGLALRDALGRETDGNPFFVGELLRHLVETGLIDRGTDGQWRVAGDVRDRGLPVSVREVIGERVARLGEETERVLSLAAVIGRDFDLDVLEAVAGIGEDRLLDVLDTAVEAILLHDVSGTRYSFAHALVEHALYDGLTGTRRARAHRRVAQAIEEICGDEPGARVGELARHYAESTAPEDLHRAVRYALAASDDALARLAPDDALHWCTQGLTLLDRRHREPDELRCGLLVALGEAQRQTGNAVFRETLLDAARLAQAIESDSLLIAAALANNRGFASVSGLVDAERVAVLEAACKVVAGSKSAEEAQLLALLAVELTYDGDLPRRRELGDRALAIARRDADLATLIRVINKSVRAIDVPETLSERLSLTAEALDAAETLGDPVLQFFCADARGYTLFHAARIDEFDEVLSKARAIAERLNQPTMRWLVMNSDASRSMLAGDLDGAERLAIEAAGIGDASGQPDTATIFTSQIGGLRMMQGRAEEIVDLTFQMVSENPQLPVFATFLGHLYCDLDRPDDARAMLEPFVSDGFRSIPQDGVWLVAMTTAAYAIAELEWADGAETLLTLLRPFAGQIPHTGGACFVEVSYFLGRLAATLGDNDGAESHFAQCARTCERIGSAWGLAANQLAWGRTLVARGDPADLARASELLGEAQRSAQERRYGLVERRARQALDALRGR
jgi:hypothetical protein